MLTYFIVINVIGFFLDLLSKYKKIDMLLIIISFFGGSLGILIAIILFNRNINKDNMMVLVFTICTFIMQLILYLLFKENYFDKFSLERLEKLNYKPFLIYLGIINLITFLAFGLDKYKAIHGKWRIKIVTLLGLCFLGGGIGGLLGVHVFKHKTNKNYFTLGIPLIILMHVIVILFLINLL